ncbi:hypothetical protein B0H14DRAFT_3427535 [Mycena olivaceomarginata]|nr:hypothetical protein B0H14DRAFT_3427535 [Mycena olivaceomarginata]
MPFNLPLRFHYHHACVASLRLLARAHSFPRSSALRPFPSVVSASGAGKKPVKMIQPPVNQRGWFVLNLTQAELGRQE